MTGKEQRKRIWIHDFQTQLTLRIGVHLLLFLLAIALFLFAWRLWSEGFNDPGEQFVRMLRDYVPVVLCVVWLVPLMGWDAMRFSHRVIGPVVRFRQTFKDVANGELVRPIKLREHDYLTELRDDANQMLDSLQRRGVPVLKPVDDASQRTSA